MTTALLVLLAAAGGFVVGRSAALRKVAKRQAARDELRYWQAPIIEPLTVEDHIRWGGQ